MNEPRPGKKLLVLDIDYTLFGNYVTCKTSYSYIILYHIYLLLIHFNEHLMFKCCCFLLVFICVSCCVFIFVYLFIYPKYTINNEGYFSLPMSDLYSGLLD